MRISIAPFDVILGKTHTVISMPNLVTLEIRNIILLSFLLLKGSGRDSNAETKGSSTPPYAKIKKTNHPYSKIKKKGK